MYVVAVAVRRGLVGRCLVAWLLLVVAGRLVGAVSRLIVRRLMLSGLGFRISTESIQRRLVVVCVGQGVGAQTSQEQLKEV